MPQVKILTYNDKVVVRNQDGKIVDLQTVVGKRVKRATKVGNKIVAHLENTIPGELLVFDSPTDYENVIRREFVVA